MLRRNPLCSKGPSFRRGIIRVAALCILCRYRHKIHSTGHKTRFDRFDQQTEAFKAFKASYAFEELIAEIGAAFTCAELGIQGQHEQHASYLDHWLKKW